MRMDTALPFQGLSLAGSFAYPLMRKRGKNVTARRNWARKSPSPPLTLLFARCEHAKIQR